MHIGCIDLFCGAGGLTLGLLEAGLHVSLGVDADEKCRFPYEHNTGVPFMCKDVDALNAEVLQSAFSDYSVRVLAGCAPCQPFSTYTHTNKVPDEDRRWHLLRRFSDFICDLKPEIVTMENVWKLERHPIFEQFVSVLRKAGYDVWHKVVSCKDYGVPQTRRRLVLMASLIGPAPQLSQSQEKAPTVKEVIGDLPRLKAGGIDPSDSLHRSSSLSSRNLERIRASRPGGTWRDWPDHLIADCHLRESGSRFPSVYGRMKWEQLAPTITGQCYGFGNGRFGHPEQDRALSLREAALLQTFPPHAVFTPPDEVISISSVGQMIGNAVPPKLGAAVGRAILSSIQA